MSKGKLLIWMKASLAGLLSLLLLSGCVSSGGDITKKGVDKTKALDLHVRLAKNYVGTGNRESARLHLRKAFEIDKNSAEATDTLGMLYELEGEPALAEKTFKKALKLKKDFTEAHNNYGVFLFSQRRYEEALEQFELAAADLDYDGRAEALVNVGRTSLMLGHDERAHSAFEHATILDRNLAAAYIELADMNLRTQAYADAKQNLDRYMSLMPPNPRALLIGIRLERIFGNRDKEASYALLLKNKFPYSSEYLEYKNSMLH